MGNKRMKVMPPPAALRDVVARVESQWRVTLAPFRESRHA